jgi:hypothetical protein
MTLYNICNDYFMAHQPAFMLGMFIGFGGLCLGASILDTIRVRRANRKG